MPITLAHRFGVLALCIISFIMLMYSRSLVYSVSVTLSILYSLLIAYFFYVYVFQVRFFPFMNMLVFVLVVGIGADDTFVLTLSVLTTFTLR